MSKLKSSISGFVTVVFFLVLTALASVWYGGDGEQQAKLDQNAIYQKTRATLGAILSSSEKLADVNLKRNIGVGGKIKDELEAMDLNKLEQAKEKISSTSWAELADRFKESWQNKNITQEGENDKFLAWEKDESTGTIVIKLKNGQEYRLPPLDKWFNKE